MKQVKNEPSLDPISGQGEHVRNIFNLNRALPPFEWEVGKARQQPCHFVGFRYADKMTFPADLGGRTYADPNRQILLRRFAAFGTKEHPRLLIASRTKREVASHNLSFLFMPQQALPYQYSIYPQHYRGRF